VRESEISGSIATFAVRLVSRWSGSSLARGRRSRSGQRQRDGALGLQRTHLFRHDHSVATVPRYAIMSNG